MRFNRRKMLTAGAGVAAVAATSGVASAEPAESAAPVRSDAALARSLTGGFASHHAEVNEARLHYVAGGKGAPLILLPGWPQTWWEFRKIMPSLARRYRVIAVDLRGMGGSGKPAAGYDKKTMARDIYELAHRLGYDEVNIAGHDIGAMVAHSFAINHADATTKVALLDVAHPDEGLYQLALLPKPDEPVHLWWFAFNQLRTLPEQLLTGRSRYLIDHLCDLLLVNPAAIGESARAVYAHAYAKPDAIRAGNGWYQTFAQDIEDQRAYGKVNQPMLGLASAASYEYFQYLLPTKGTDVRVGKVDGSGHFLAEEQPEAVVRALTEFFG